MRIRSSLALVALASLLALTPASAQVTVNPNALDPLTQKPAPKPAQPAPPAKPPAKPAAAGGTTIRPNMAPVQAVPQTPPAAPVMPPPAVVPTRPAPPVTPAPVAADAPGLATPLPGGVRLTFGPGRTDLNPSTEATIRALVHGGPGVPPAADNASFTVTTYAAGTPEDPSTARRLSLSRALAVRSVLISQGIASIRIYVKAFGPASPGFADGPPDRADVVVGGPVLPPAAPAPTPQSP